MTEPGSVESVQLISISVAPETMHAAFGEGHIDILLDNRSKQPLDMKVELTEPCEGQLHARVIVEDPE